MTDIYQTSTPGSDTMPRIHPRAMAGFGRKSICRRLSRDGGPCAATSLAIRHRRHHAAAGRRFPAGSGIRFEALRLLLPEYEGPARNGWSAR